MDGAKTDANPGRSIEWRLMPPPLLSFRIETWTPAIGRDSRARSRQAFGPAGAYYFPYLLAKAQPGRREILVAEDAGSLCLFQWTAAEGRLDLLFPPGTESGILAAPSF